MHLFDPLQLGPLTLRNRVGVPAMCQYSAQDGAANDWHLMHYGAFAAGGAGLVIVEATAVLPEGRITPMDLGLWNDAQVEPLQRVAAFVRSHGATAAIQLAHAGRKASTRWPWDTRGLAGAPVPAEQGGWTPQAPSAVAFSEQHEAPTALDQNGIDQVVAAFAAAARRAVQADFEVVEIHAAHGYLLHEFLSPLSNLRTDAYGGSLANRMRLTLQVVDAVRAAVDVPVLVRLSATDWAPGGWDLEQTLVLARELKTRGVTLIDVSTGGLVPYAQVPAAAGFQVPFAQAVRDQAGIATAAVGLITGNAQAEAIIAQSLADLVLVGRAMLRDPHWTQSAARELGQPIPVPPQLARGW